MNYRKLAASKIFDGYRFVPDHVLILTEDGCVEAVVPKEEAGESTENLEGILCPGLVNCHCHLELSHMKGRIPEGTGLVDFVFKVVTERGATEEEILLAIAAAEEEMKASGVVAVGDICNNTQTLPQKEKRNLHYYNFIEASGWLPEVAVARFERIKVIYEAYRHQVSILNREGKHSFNVNLSTSACSIVPHAPYSVSPELWRAIQPYFAGKVVSIHNQETSCEDEFFRQGTGDFQRMYGMMKIDNSHHRPTGRSSLQSYFENLTGAGKIIFVHNTFTTEEDVLYIKRQTEAGQKNNPQLPPSKPQVQTFFCLCVNANQYIEKALPPIEVLRKNGCTIVLGTDSLASNWSLSVLDEIKAIRKNFTHIPLEEMLGWATMNGAIALGMDRFLGSFEKGKKPGVVLLSESELAIQKLVASS